METAIPADGKLRPKSGKTTAIGKRDVLGQLVRIVAGPLAGKTGCVTHVEPDKNGHPHFRVAFDPPVAIATAGSVAAVWRRQTEIERVA